jgi:hypothetical protein
MEKTTQDILNEAAALLEEEGRWIKGRLFKTGPNGKGCSMCAHGAIAYCGNRAIRDLIEENKMSQANDVGNAIINGGGGIGDEYSQRKSIYAAHQNAKKVGLTFAYNDATIRTKGEVIGKLHEAAQL